MSDSATPLGSGREVLRIVVYAEPTLWCAWALECDIRARGRTAEIALDTLIKIVERHVAADLRMGREPLSAFKVTPADIWNKFAATLGPVEVRRNPSSTRLRYVVATAVSQAAAAGH